jgi:cell division protein ZapA
MSNPKPVTVRIFDKEYTVGCPDGERQSLFAAVDLLNERMGELRDTGKVIGSERIAVMAALNLAHDLLKVNTSHSSTVSSLGDRLHRLNSKVDEALARGRRAQALRVEAPAVTQAPPRASGVSHTPTSGAGPATSESGFSAAGYAPGRDQGYGIGTTSEFAPVHPDAEIDDLEALDSASLEDDDADSEETEAEARFRASQRSMFPDADDA